MNTARAELLKLLTLPAPALTVALTLGLTGLLTAASDGALAVPYARAGFLVLGVLAATSEYDDGQIRTTLLGTPRRLPLHLVRTAVLATVSAPVAVAVVLVADVGAPVAAYLVLTTLLGASVGTLLRQPLPAVVVLFGYYYGLGPFLRPHVHDGRWLPALWTAAAVAAATWSVTRRDA